MNFPPNKKLLVCCWATSKTNTKNEPLYDQSFLWHQQPIAVSRRYQNANTNCLVVAQKLGVPLGKAEIKRFADQEIGVQIGENVRGCDVFLIQACR